MEKQSGNKDCFSTIREKLYKEACMLLKVYAPLKNAFYTSRKKRSHCISF